jgi:hypothetical protein
MKRRWTNGINVALVAALLVMVSAVPAKAVAVGLPTKIVGWGGVACPVSGRVPLVGKGLCNAHVVMAVDSPHASHSIRSIRVTSAMLPCVTVRNMKVRLTRENTSGTTVWTRWENWSGTHKRSCYPWGDNPTLARTITSTGPAVPGQVCMTVFEDGRQRANSCVGIRYKLFG